MSRDLFISELIARFPNGNEKLESEIRSLKRKLDEVEFSDVDEDEYCNFADAVEGKLKKDNKLHNKCHLCQKTFIRKGTLTRHILSHKTKFECETCHSKFGRKDNLNRHRRLFHGIKSSKLNGKRHCSKLESKFVCKYCDEEFPTYDELFQHITKSHPLNSTQAGGRRLLNSTQTGGREPLAEKSLNDRNTSKNKSSNHIQTKEHSALKARRKNAEQSALQNTVQNRIIYPRNEEQYDLLTFFANTRDEISHFLISKLRQHGIKWHLSVQVELVREGADGSVVATCEPHFRSLTYSTLNVDVFSEHDLNEAFHKMSKSLEAHLRDSSGWIIRKVIHLTVPTVIYSPLAGSSYIPLPDTLKKSNCILNIKNLNDEKCFVYSVLAFFHPIEFQSELVSHYIPYENELNMQDIKYPVTINQIDKFESQNKHTSVNVFTFEGSEILPLRITKQNGRPHHVNLLLLQNENNSHYCLIKNTNKFLSRLKSNAHEHFVCNYCLHMFTKQSLLEDHTPYCSINGAQRVELPTEHNALLEFKDYEKTLKVPFVIYGDFETLNRKLTSCDADPSLSNTTHTTLLTPCSFGYKVVCVNPEYSKPTTIYQGPNAVEKLIECLLEEKHQIEQILGDIQPLNLSQKDYKSFNEADRCCLCSKLFDFKENRARHHDHFTGHFVGAAHMNCNLQCKQSKFIPVIFHGLRNFDSHCLCQSIGHFKDRQLKCIPQNMEKYVSFSLDSLRFIDSLQFLPSSLETLVENLSGEGPEAFKNLQSEFPDPKQFNLLIRKGIYPYDYMDDESRFDENKLPAKNAFYNNIKREHITNSDYMHAQNVFKTLGCQNLGDYHDLYLKTDVLLLSDIFEQFRKVCLTRYELDPCHFYTSPGLSWQALLKKTGVCLELITDIDQILFIEKGIRGGISQISNRYKKPNNKFVAGYNSTQTNSFLSYIDANNLYGWAMSQPLPHGFFRFLESEEIKKIDILTIPTDNTKGYILEVSLKYPKHLHEQHNDLPLAPEKKHVENEALSPYAQRVFKKLYGISNDGQLPTRSKVPKLLTTLHDKDKYILHYRNLQLYLQLGLEIKEIHRVLEFQQEAWMAPYVEFNTQMRKNAKSSFEKNFYKLMNNAVFGKTMENVRKHKNVELCHQANRMRKLAAKPTYKTHRIFSEDLVAVEMLRAKVTLNKPMYVGMCVLDLSKCLMYDFYYNHLKKMYGEKLQLQMTDTDSFLFYCETENILDDMEQHLDLYDTSDFPKDHPLHSEVNKKVMGKMKSETNEKCISEFAGLRSKMYSYICDGQEEKRAKGIAKVTVREDLRLETYKQTLFNETEVQSKMNVIRSHGHQIYCDRIVKTGLSCFDDKRYLLEDGISSLAYGHYKIST